MKLEDRPEVRRLEHVVNINWIKIAAIAVVSVLIIKYSDPVIGQAGVLLNAMKPLLYGFVIAYVLNIFMKRLERLYFPKKPDAWVQRTRRPVCVFSSVILVLAIVIFLILLVVPSLFDSIQVLTKDIPTSFVRFQKWMVKISADTPWIQDYVENVEINWNSLFGKISEFLQKGVGSLFNSAFSMTKLLASFAFTGIISLIFAIYMLFGKETLRRQLGRLLHVYAPRKPRGDVLRFVSLAHETFTSYIIGQITEAFILGTLCGAGMFLFRLPYALMTGVIVGATALVPVMGAYIGAIVGAFLIVTVSPLKAVEFVIYLAVLQQIEGNIIYPRVVGGSIGLPGIWVLAAVSVGGGLLGIPGMIIGVPLTATVYKWIRMDVSTKLQAEAEATQGKEDPSGTAQKEEHA